MYDLIIIGGGPAGVTAGIYAARQRINALLVAKNIGGQLANKAVAIENYTGFESVLGMDLIRKFESHLKKQKIEIKIDDVAKLKKEGDDFLVLTGGGKEFKSKSVIVASGSEPRFLGVPGEKEFVGKGVSYCVICDGLFFNDKITAIIGGGNAAFESAIFLSNIAKKIYIFESGPEIKADAENQRRVMATGKTEIIANAILKEIKGDSFVKGIIYQDKITQESKILELEGVFVKIGNKAATSFVAKDLVDFNEFGEIEVEKETLQTKTPGLFAAGDVNVGKYKQIITSCGEGAKAALANFEYLKSKNE